MEWFESSRQTSEYFKYIQEPAKKPFACRTILGFAAVGWVTHSVWKRCEVRVWDSFFSTVILVSSLSFLFKFVNYCEIMGYYKHINLDLAIVDICKSYNFKFLIKGK